MIRRSNKWVIRARRVLLTGLLLISLGLGSYPLVAQDLDRKFQAVFIYGIARRIEWSTSDNHFKIGVVGNNNELLNELQKLASAKKIYGKPIVIEKVEEFSGNHNILFLSKNKKSELGQLLSTITKNTLVITDFKGAVNQGAHFNFILDGNKIAFELNETSLKETNLKISNELIKLAAMVQ